MCSSRNACPIACLLPCFEQLSKRCARCDAQKAPLSRPSRTTLVGIVAEGGEWRRRTENPGRKSSLPQESGWNLNVNKQDVLAVHDARSLMPRSGRRTGREQMRIFRPVKYHRLWSASCCARSSRPGTCRCAMSSYTYVELAAESPSRCMAAAVPRSLKRLEACFLLLISQLRGGEEILKFGVVRHLL